MSKILVTGGLGYIGSHTVVELYNAGFEPIIIDNLSNSDRDVLNGLKQIIGVQPSFIELDITDFIGLRKLFSEHEIEAVVHFAAAKAVEESVEDPLKYYHNNVSGTVTLLEVMKEFQVDQFIFSSSCTVYGQPDQLPVSENSPIKKAESPYGNTKQVCEEVLRDTIQATKTIKGITLRYFNPIGAHATAHIGEKPQGIPNNLLPYLLKVVVGELEQLSVFGNNYDTPDGSCIRDYIHVVDLAKAHVIALQRIFKAKNKSKYEVFNIGTGEGYSVLQLIETFENVTGKKVKYKIVDRRPGDIEKIYSDTTLANNDLGWRAELDLVDMLSSAWKWQQSLNAKG